MFWLHPSGRSDQYFEGANNSIQHANVNSIISANILSLMEDPGRKFIYVEMAFWTRWWDEQSESKKADVRGLVARGQLEFINGGWSMHDEVNMLLYWFLLSRFPFLFVSSTQWYFFLSLPSSGLPHVRRHDRLNTPRRPPNLRQLWRRAQDYMAD